MAAVSSLLQFPPVAQTELEQSLCALVRQDTLEMELITVQVRENEKEMEKDSRFRVYLMLMHVENLIPQLAKPKVGGTSFSVVLSSPLAFQTSPAPGSVTIEVN